MGSFSGDISAAEPAAPHWRKSRHSGGGGVGNCVELAALVDDGIAVRNSRHPNGPALSYASAEMTTFVAGIKNNTIGTVHNALN